MEKSMFERWLEATTKTGDVMLQYQFQKDMIKDTLLTDSVIDEIADRVIQRLSIKVDASEIIAAIDEINKRLNDLGK